MDDNTDSQGSSDNPNSSKAEYVRPKSSAEEDAKTSTSASTEEGGAFECNICFEPSKNSVVTMCGHLFCWPCLSRWLEARGANAVCPVCKSAVSRDRCVPIYGRNADSQSDPRNSGASSSGASNSSDIPRRPQGQREEPAPNANFFNGPFNIFPDMAGGNGFNLSFGIGAFPFALFSTFNLGGNAGMVGPNGQRRNGANADGQVPDIVLSRAFLLLAFIFIFWMALL